VLGLIHWRYNPARQLRITVDPVSQKAKTKNGSRAADHDKWLLPAVGAGIYRGNPKSTVSRSLVLQGPAPRMSSSASGQWR